MSNNLNKRVLFITPQPFLANRGSPLRVRSEVEALLTLGYQVDVLCLPYGTDWEKPGIRIHRSWTIPGIGEPAVGPSWQKIALDIPLTLKSLLLGLGKNERYDAIHGVEEAAFIAQAIGGIRGTPYVADLHSLLPDQLRYSGFLSNKTLINLAFKAYNRCLKQSSGIVAVCKDVQDYVMEVAPEIPCAQLEDLPLDSSWETTPENEAALKLKFSLEGKKVLTYTGNFSSYQGIPLLLEAYSCALKSLPEPDNQRLLLVGESNEDLLSEAKDRAAALGITPNVIFTGELPAEMMGSIMAISDALVSPRSKGGNTPLKVYCYMASGKPLIATSISSHTQALDERSAYLAQPEPQLFSVAIIQALSDDPDQKSLQNQKAIGAQALLDSRFNKKAFTKAMGWLYERVTQAPLPAEDWEETLIEKASLNKEAMSLKVAT